MPGGSTQKALVAPTSGGAKGRLIRAGARSLGTPCLFRLKLLCPRPRAWKAISVRQRPVGCYRSLKQGRTRHL
jgi:hypothetical protein